MTDGVPARGLLRSRGAGGAEMLQEDARRLAAEIRSAGKAMAYVARFVAHALQDAHALADEVH